MKFSSVQLLGQSRSPGSNTSPRGENATTHIQYSGNITITQTTTAMIVRQTMPLRSPIRDARRR